MGTVLRRVFRSRQRGFLGWGAGVILLIGVTIAAYPSVRDQVSLDELVEDYPDFIQKLLGLDSGLSISSPEGYLNSQFFTNMLPLIFIIFLVSFGVREIAGEEKDGTLDLLLSHPITRTNLYFEKLAAMLLAGIGMLIVSLVVMLVGAPLVSMEVGVSGLAGAAISVFLAALLFGVLGMAVGAFTGKRVVGIAVAAGFAVASYILWGLAPLVSEIEPLERLSPFFWALAGDPILHGVRLGNAALLIGVSAVFAGLGLVGFRRRDISV